MPKSKVFPRPLIGDLNCHACGKMLEKAFDELCGKNGQMNMQETF